MSTRLGQSGRVITHYESLTSQRSALQNCVFSHIFWKVEQAEDLVVKRNWERGFRIILGLFF